MIDDATYNALCEMARSVLPNLAKWDGDTFVRFASESEIVDAATAALESKWHVSLDTAEYTIHDEQAIVAAYAETHITAARSSATRQESNS